MAQAVMAVGATDAAINSNHLKLLKLDFASSALDMPVLSSASVQERFNRLSWSKVGSGALEEFPLGLIAGGLADGSLHFWNPQKLLRCESKWNLQSRFEIVISCNVHAFGLTPPSLAALAW
jgi:protein transport protein SEC31